MSKYDRFLELPEIVERSGSGEKRARVPLKQGLPLALVVGVCAE